MLISEGLLPVVCVLSRGGLNSIDRYLFGIKGLDVNLQNCINSVFPLIIGLCLTSFFYPNGQLMTSFWGIECFLSAVLMQFVSYAFSLSFKQCCVRDVIVTTKIADLIFIPILCLLCLKFFDVESLTAIFQKPSVLPYLIGLCACVPLFIGAKNLAFLLHPTALLLVASLSAQFFLSLLIKKETLCTIEQGLFFTLGIFVWRSIFSLSILLFSEKVEIRKEEYTLSFMWQVVGRACLMLVSYATFVLSLELRQPLIVFPILNSGPLVSALLAQIFLNEKLKKREVVAIFGLSCSSMLYSIHPEN